MRLILVTLTAVLLTATAWAQSIGPSGGYDYSIAPGAAIPDKLQEAGPGLPNVPATVIAPAPPPVGPFPGPQSAPIAGYVPGQEAFDRDCHRVVADGYWQGRWAHVAGMMCYDAGGQGFVHPNSIHLLHYHAADPNQGISRPLSQSRQGAGVDPLDMLQMLSIGLSFGVGGGGC